jgi:hypothetical protein
MKELIASKIKDYSWNLVRCKGARSACALPRDGRPGMYVTICQPDSLVQKFGNTLNPGKRKEMHLMQ